MSVATNAKPPAPSGWTLDGDGWYVRAMRPSDLRIDTVTSQRAARHFGRSALDQRRVEASGITLATGPMR